MKIRDVKSMARRGSENRESGFSMIELVVVVSIIMIIGGMAIFALQPVLQDTRFDTGMRQVLDQLRQAREYSVTNHRYVQVTFPTVVVAGVTRYEVVMTELNSAPFGPGGTNTVLSTVPIEPPATFYVFPSPAPDTPDKFGNTAAIWFENTANGPPGGMMFQSDGQFVDKATFQPISGTVFLGQQSKNTSARAITVLGSTGRVRGWKSNGSAWFQF